MDNIIVKDGWNIITYPMGHDDTSKVNEESKEDPRPVGTRIV